MALLMSPACRGTKITRMSSAGMAIMACSGAASSCIRRRASAVRKRHNFSICAGDISKMMSCRLSSLTKAHAYKRSNIGFDTTLLAYRRGRDRVRSSYHRAISMALCASRRLLPCGHGAGGDEALKRGNISRASMIEALVGGLGDGDGARPRRPSAGDFCALSTPALIYMLISKYEISTSNSIRPS